MLAVALTVTVVVPALAARPGGRPPDASPLTFTIRGDVEGLFPGAALPVLVEVVNDGPRPLAVTHVEAAVGDASATCPGSLLHVEAFTGRVTVPARSTGTVTMVFSMSTASPDACQTATWPVRYAGTATKG